jgi:spore coat polysaccharide biosynthesis predicted glycosyltransferase SpsG
MKNKHLAIQNYKRFCKLEGNEYIASEFALGTILKIIKKFKVNTVLELGLGIGSIADTVLKWAKKGKKEISYIGTENNEFCLNALKSNVVDYDQIELFSELNQIKNKKFDLIIIDGYDETLKDIVSFCKMNAIIFIEGDRKGQTEAILQIFPNSKYVNVITLIKNKPYAHGYSPLTNYIGGGQLIFINPTFKMKVYWIQQKVETFMINKIRKYRSK